MFCSKCGSQIPEGAAFCVNCGQAVTPVPERSQPQYNPPQPQYSGPQYNQYGYQNIPEQDASNAGLAILSFFVPIIGIILYCIWRDQTPLKAKSCLNGALTAIILGAVFGILGIILVFLIPAFAMNI